MASVGEILRRARLLQGLDLATVSLRLRINLKYLEAIEADDRSGLPSGFFYKSFVDQYARLLSLDTREIDAEIDRVLSAEAPLPLPGQESQVSKNVPPVKLTPRFRGTRALASFAALIGVLVGCSAIYAWWHKARASSPASVASTPPAFPASTATTQPAASPAQGVQATPGYKVMLDLLAREETWLSVYSDGKRVFSGILAPNQSKTIEGKEFAKMKVGNAAGLEVRLNGRLISPLGGRGQVLTVLFTPDNFQIVPQSPKEGD